MFISMNWIEDFVDLSGVDKEDLINRFTLSTAEVEEIIYKGNDINGVVSGKILTIEDIPESRKLHMLTVDAGDKVYDIVCGAPNVKTGMIVPLAKEGAHVCGMDIGVATLAGHESHGMCCSERELGISDEHQGLMELPQDTPLGVDITELYDIKDTIFEVDNKSLTNRPDLWGHYGIAREIAAILGRELKPFKKMDLSAYDDLSPVDIKILDEENCYRYCGLKVSNVTKKVSPINMRIRLFYAGTRAINLLADLTNYLMLELGQPMHAFDCAKVDSIVVKHYDKPFEFKTLDSEKRTIDENTLMITCKDEPVAIAGIMGGLASEIEDDTTDLLLESATFNAVSIRKSSTRLGLRTDASMRYEKTLDPEMTFTAIERFMQLLIEIDPDVKVVSSLSDAYVYKYPEISISFDKAFIDLYTGIDISNEQIYSTLSSLGFKTDRDGDNFVTTVPSWRATKDVTMKADIVEEVTRIYGYDNFVIDTTKSALRPVKRTNNNRYTGFVKDTLVEKYGLHEVHSYIWADKKKFSDIGIETEDNIKLVSAMTPDHDTIRNSMTPTLLSFVNENKAYAPEFGIFEIGSVVEGLKADGLCDEHKKLGIVLFSKLKSEKELYYSLLEMVNVLADEICHRDASFEIAEATHAWQHPKNTAGIIIDNKTLGFTCVIHPIVKSKIDKKAVIVAAEIDMLDFSDISVQNITYKEPSKFPGISIDLSLVVGKNDTFKAVSAAWENAGSLLSSVELIDTFDMGETSSITLRFSFISNEKTLTRDELQPQIDLITDNLAKMGIMLKV